MATSASELVRRKCKACEPGTPALTSTQVSELLGVVPGWVLREGKQIERAFKFKNYHETMAFVNAVAWIAHGEDHHPDMEVGYNTCVIRYSTHSVGGLSENDFICAAKVNELMK